ncbi:MAG: hypothetical protein IPP96_14010 [Chitinophagaceae bacterium]|nr:hypothetical protein [Chitinophagaceae bacterium]
MEWITLLSIIALAVGRFYCGNKDGGTARMSSCKTIYRFPIGYVHVCH